MITRKILQPPYLSVFLQSPCRHKWSTSRLQPQFLVICHVLPREFHRSPPFREVAPPESNTVSAGQRSAEPSAHGARRYDGATEWRVKALGPTRKRFFPRHSMGQEDSRIHWCALKSHGVFGIEITETESRFFEMAGWGHLTSPCLMSMSLDAKSVRQNWALKIVDLSTNSAKNWLAESGKGPFWGRKYMGRPDLFWTAP